MQAYAQWTLAVQQLQAELQRLNLRLDGDDEWFGCTIDGSYIIRLRLDDVKELTATLTQLERR